MLRSLPARLAKHRKRLVSNFLNIFYVSSGLMMARILMLGTSVLVARFGGVGTLGEFVLFITFFQLSSDTSGAIDGAFIRSANSSAMGGRQFLSAVILAKALYAVAVFSLGWMLAPFIADYAFSNSGVTNLIRYGLLSGALYCFFLTVQAWYQQEKRFGLVGLIYPLFNLVTFFGISACAVIVGSLTIETLQDVYIVFSLILGGGGLLLFWDQIASGVSAIKKGHFEEFLRTSGVLLAVSLLTITANRFDMLFIGAKLEMEDLGYYSVAARIAYIVAMLSGAVSIIVLPKAGAALNDPNIFRKYLYLSGFYMALQLLLALAVLVFREELITLLFGAEYISVSTITVIVILQMVITGFGIPFQALIQNGRRPKDLLWIAGIKLGIGIASMLWLIPVYGLIGAAIAMAITAAIASATIIWVAMQTCVPRSVS